MVVWGEVSTALLAEIQNANSRLPVPQCAYSLYLRKQPTITRPVVRIRVISNGVVIIANALILQSLIIGKSPSVAMAVMDTSGVFVSFRTPLCVSISKARHQQK